MAKKRKQYTGEKVAVGQEEVKTALSADSDLRDAVRRVVIGLKIESEREKELDVIPEGYSDMEGVRAEVA